MKIMILTNNDIGLYKFRKELIEELVKQHEVYICLPSGNFINSLVTMGSKYIPCELLERHGINPFKELKLIQYYKKILKQYKPDIVLTYTIKPNIYGGMACSKYEIPYITNITGLGVAVEKKGLLQKIILTLYRKGLKKSKKVFFQNTENMDFMLNKNIIQGVYGLLPGSGVNLKEYSLIDYPNTETIDFVFIARIMKEKGIDQYLGAAEYIKNKYPETRFHICGLCEQDYQEKLDNLQEKGIIIYHGLVSDMLKIYKISSCTIHPTYYPEGLSNVLLESCACGRPIITTNRAGCREIVEDGINGYVIEEKNSRDLIEKIELFLALDHEEKKQMGILGRLKVEKEFDRNIVIADYLGEIKNI